MAELFAKSTDICCFVCVRKLFVGTHLKKEENKLIVIFLSFFGNILSIQISLKVVQIVDHNKKVVIFCCGRWMVEYCRCLKRDKKNFFCSSCFAYLRQLFSVPISNKLWEQHCQSKCSSLLHFLSFFLSTSQTNFKSTTDGNRFATDKAHLALEKKTEGKKERKKRNS